MAFPIIGIIADDLTGAMDSAGAMAAHDLSAEVFLDNRHDLGSATPDVICINTQSRLMPEPQAIEAVSSAAKLLMPSGCSRFYKKIDSTLRGNVGVELTAMMAAARKQRAFVCPAFPDRSRTVRNGILEVDGRPLTVSREGNDPFSGVGEASVVRLLQTQTKSSVGHLPIGIVDRGAEAVHEKTQNLFADGCDLIVLDAITTGHMSTLASVITQDYPDEIAVGSAGLASALAKAVGHAQAAKEKSLATGQSGQFLVINGSLHPASHQQVQELAASANIALLPMSAVDILREQGFINAIATQVAIWASRAFSRGQHASIYWEDPDSLRALLEGDSADESANKWQVQAIAEFYRGVLEKLTEQSKMSGLVVVGGETAYMVARAVQARSVLVTGEVRPGIPVGRLVGGLAAERLLVTKAGGFGGPTALVEVIEYLKAES